MNRKNRDFYKRPTVEQELLTEGTWCNFCNEADLGLDQPIEYEQDGKIYIEGNCKKCGHRLTTEIITKNIIE